MDAQETRIYTAIIITSIVIGCIIIYFIISVFRQQRKIHELYKQNILTEITAIEKDRARIAYDLHDELGPVLALVKLEMNNFELTEPADKIQIDKTNDHIDNVLQSIREISYNLMPNALLSLGLISALGQYINNIKTNSSLKISFSYPEAILLNEETSINIYRIVQEIIHNTIKHSKASQLCIEFETGKDKLIMSLKDDGIGFDKKEILDSGGLGLKSLLSRTQLMNGKMFLESKKGSGTEFTFEIPY